MNQRELDPSLVSKSRPENPDGGWKQRAPQQMLSNLYWSLARSGGCNAKLLHRAARQLLENGSQSSRPLEKSEK